MEISEILEFVSKYYGLDWLGTILTILCLHNLKKKKSSGFIFGALASLSWLFFTILVSSLAGMIANTLFVFMHISGYLKWKKEQAELKELNKLEN